MIRALLPLLLAGGLSAQTIEVRSSAPPGAQVVHALVPIPIDSEELELFHAGRAVAMQAREAARTRSWRVLELAAAIDRSAPVELLELRPRREATPELPAVLALFDRDLISLVASPSVRMRLTRQDGSRWAARAGEGARVTWVGPLTVRWRSYLRTPAGSLVLFWSLDAGERSLELSVLWTNGDLPAAPDRLLRSLELLLPEGWTFTSLVPDPVVVDPWLVPTGRHAILSRGERTFRLAVHRADERAPELFEGLGIADWTRGGYLAAGFRAPKPPATGDLGLSRDLAHERARMAAGGMTSPGSRAPSPLWPTSGVPYGGMTSGLWIEQVPGLRSACVRSPDGPRLAAVEAVGWRARHPGNLYPGGEPIFPEDYLAADGSAPWRIFDLRFERSGGIVQDLPFRYSALPPLTPELEAWCPYLQELRGWAPSDSQHLVRAFRGLLELAWLAGDDLARFQLAADAAMSRMQLWPGPGTARRLPLPPSEPNLGGSFGRGEAWAAVVVASDLALQTEPRRRDAGLEWLRAWVLYLEAVQLPTGLLSVASSGKVFTDPPFSSAYLVHRSNEQVYLLQGLAAAWEAGIDEARGVAQRLADGLWLFASRAGTGSVLERYPAGPIDGPLYLHQGEIPPELFAQIGGDSYQCGSIGAFAALMRAPFAGWQVLDYTGRPTFREAREVFRSWGRAAPSARSGSTFESWGATLGALDGALRP